MLDLDWAGIYGSQVYFADIKPSVAPFTQRPASVQRMLSCYNSISVRLSGQSIRQKFVSIGWTWTLAKLYAT